MTGTRGLAARMIRYMADRRAELRLSRMDDRMLKDIGIHRSAIAAAVRGGDRTGRQAGAVAPAPMRSRNGATSGPCGSLRSAVIE